VLAIVIALAVVAAFLYALSEYLQQRAAFRSAQTVDTDAEDRSARLLAEAGAAGRALRRMARERVWFLGWALGTTAFFVQAAALNLGSVSVVQSLQVTTLIFTLPLAGIGSSVRPRLRDWLGAGTIAVGLAVFLAVRGVAPGASHAHRGRLLLLLVALAGLVVVLALAGALRSGPIRATLLASAAGVSLAATASMIKLTSNDLVHHGVIYTATDWPGYALALGTATGVVLQQLAFASGRLPVAATAMTIANPLIGTVLAVIGFNEPMPRTAGGLAGLAIGGALVCVGVYVLAHSPLLAEPLPPPAELAEEAAGHPHLRGSDSEHRYDRYDDHDRPEEQERRDVGSARGPGRAR
jgi:drug/metabolite transporter (DMT)-like permease